MNLPDSRWCALPLVLALVGCPPAASFERERAPLQAAALAVTNPGTVDIDPTPFDRVTALSDVHGMYGQLVKNLVAAKLIDGSQHWIGGRTLLLVVGDSIDKGPQSIEVLDLFMALTPQAQAAGGRVVHLLGNHEAEFLANGGANDKAAELLAELAAKHIPVTDLTDPTKPRGAFLAGMPLAAKVGRWLFCHAGLYPDMTWAAFGTAAAGVLARRAYGDPLLAGNDSILEAKDWWTDPSERQALEKRLEANGMFGLVQGHQPKAYGIVYRLGAIDGGHLIKLDGGMAPEAGSNPGGVLIFEHAVDMLKDAFPDVVAVSGAGVSPIRPE